MIFTKPGMLHRINFSDNAVYDRYDILFDEKIVFKEIFDKIPKDTNVFYMKKPKKIEEIFQKMDARCAFPDPCVQHGIYRAGSRVLH